MLGTDLVCQQVAHLLMSRSADLQCSLPGAAIALDDFEPCLAVLEHACTVVAGDPAEDDDADGFT